MSRYRQTVLGLWVSAAMASIAPLAHADGWGVFGAISGPSAVIDHGVAVGAAGRVSVNEAAGTNNAQSNSAVIVSGGSVGIGVNGTQQFAISTTPAGASSATIAGNAFSGVTGLTQVNQSSGNGNLQHNAAIIDSAVAGVEIVPDTALSGAISKGGPAGKHNLSDQLRSASISPDAFKGASGLVQVNQSAGIGNVTANVFVLRPPAGTSF